MSPGRRRQPRTLAEWLAGLERTGWKGRRVGREHVGPCPLCGGTDRFHVGPGSRVPVLAGCRHGCTFARLAEAVHGRTERRRGPRRPDWTRSAPKPRRGPQNGARAVSGDSGGVRGETEAVGSPVTHFGAPPRGRSTPGIRPKVEEHAAPVNAAGRPDFPALAEWIEAGSALGPDARRWIEGRGLKPDRLEGAGWRSVETPADSAKLRAALSASGARWPGDPAARWLIVPVWDVDGRAVSVRTRRLPHGKPLTLKGDRARLYGADAANAPPGGVLHVCEGETDRETLIEAGALAVVGLPGCGSLHGAVAALARRSGARGVVVWLDGDPAGRLAAERLGAALARAGLVSRPWLFPPGMDCNDVWRADPDGLRRAVRGMEGDPWMDTRTAA